MIVREIRLRKVNGEWVEGQTSEFEAVNTMADAINTRRLIGWTETRLPERDADGFVYYRFDYKGHSGYQNGEKIEAVIIGYKEATLDTP